LSSRDRAPRRSGWARPCANATLPRAPSSTALLDLAAVCFDGPAERLNRTDVCQPALLVHAYAASQAHSFDGHEVVAAAGLSLGEYTANLFAGALDFETAVDLVRKRGAWMQEACDATPSGMVAVLGFDLEKTRAAIAGIGGVGVANVNGPGEIVISGANEPLAKASEACKAAGAKRCIPLKVAGAYHSPVMAPAQEKMRGELAKAKFAAPKMPVVANVSGQAVTDPAGLKSSLAEQICGSVLWDPCVRTLASLGATRFIEFGPGKKLAGMVRKIVETAETESYE
jgi:[acyl-carrier-protein] S-malonyltransferase